MKAGGVSENGDDNAIHASGVDTTSGKESRVTVYGDVSESGAGDAIYANNSTVIVNGDVVENDDGYAINATGKNTTVKVKGDVKENGSNDVPIHAENGATVIIGGNVTKVDSKDSDAIFTMTEATIIVEGVVDGNLFRFKDEGNTYLGQLNGNIKGDSSLDGVHYLIGTADGLNNKINVVGEIISTDTVDGVKNNGYYYTTTADSSKLSGKSFLIKSTVSDKKMKIEGQYDNVDIKLNDDGSYTLTIGENFKGGLQALNVIFEDIARKIASGGGSSQPIFTGTPGNPVTNGKWTQNADGTWSYATSVKFTNDWAYIAKPGEEGSAAWYFFDRNGKMLTGWQLLTWNGVKNWYYFSQTKDANEGKCQLGGITPDGYKVGADGAWIEK